MMTLLPVQPAQNTAVFIETHFKKSKEANLK
jgi:hypothetical protein